MPLRRFACPLARLGVLFLLSAIPVVASAVPNRPDGGALDAGEALPVASSEQSLDPIGLDDSTGRELDRAAARFDEARKRAQQVVIKPTAAHGDVLTSIEAVREVAHRVSVRLAEGLAFVDVELIFESRATTPAEIAYRLAVPADSALYALAVCELPAPAANGKRPPAQAASCRDAEPDAQPKAAPRTAQASGAMASAKRILDARGSALSLRASAIDKSHPLALRLAYVARAPLHGGVVRFRLPARGYDPRVAATEITLRGDGFAALEPATSATIDAHVPYDLRAELRAKPGPKTVTTRASCGGKPCVRTYQAAAALPLIARPTWLLLDTSPSMQGPARNAADTALASLLTELPETSQLRVFAFAARVQELGRYTPDAAPLKKLSDALLSELGASTQPARVLDAHRAELLGERPRVLLLSDGKLDRGTLSALSAYTRRGVELWLLALAPLASEIPAAFAGVVEAFGSEGEALDERLRAALGPRSALGLPAGEELVRESAPKVPFPRRASDGWLAHWFSRRSSQAFATRGVFDAGAVTAAPFESAPEPPAAADTGMPKESVLSMLRTQLVPEARACLRTDRKGRADYAVSLTFHALFAEREAYEVRIEGRIPEALRGCLADVIARLRIPAFSGRIRVRYPIHTEREPEAPVIELEPDALEQVNRVISGK